MIIENYPLRLVSLASLSKFVFYLLRNLRQLCNTFISAFEASSARIFLSSIRRYLARGRNRCGSERSAKWEPNANHARMHARTWQRAYIYFFLPIFIISVFRKFGRVAQHRSQFGFSHSRSARRCPRFPGKIGNADRRRAVSPAASVIREEMPDEADEERRNGGGWEKSAREERRYCGGCGDVSEIATFCGTILSWRIVARCPYDTMTDVPLRHG